MKLLYRCVNYFGLIYGLTLYIKIKGNNISKILLPSYKHSFELRSNTTDLDMFYQVFFNKCYDFKVQVDPKVIVDAGANIGLASIFFAEKYPSSKIISIEPEINNFKFLDENCTPYENIIPVNAALWNNNSDIIIENKGYGESGFMVKESAVGTSFKGMTLNTIVNDYKLERIDILKVDIEGSELEVFQENYNWLSITKVLVIELHDHMKKGTSKSVFSAISEYDFDLSLRGENLVFTNNSI